MAVYMIKYKIKTIPSSIGKNIFCMDLRPVFERQNFKGDTIEYVFDLKAEKDF